MIGAILLSGTMVRFCSCGVAMTVPSAARMREVWASGSVVNSLGSSLKTSTPLRARAPVAPTAGITRPAASSPSTSADARNAPSRLMTPPIEVVREDMGPRVTAHSMATGFVRAARVLRRCHPWRGSRSPVTMGTAVVR